ncbi:MAG: ribosomal protein [Candidatus Nomurabacteria bacterium]|nr:ribosomal protein [Candidatus Nomurabacteria bacterium]
MKVILLKSVPKLGKKDEVITVPDGYAQNALLPKKLAIIATDQAVAALKRTQENKITEKKIQHELLDKAIESLAGQTLVYHTKKNEKGSLFSKVTESDISKTLLDQHRISIDAKLMTIKEGHIKQIGTYTVDITDGDYKSEFIVSVE